MKPGSIVVSELAIKDSIRFLDEHLRDASIIKLLGPDFLMSQADTISVVTSNNLPPDPNFFEPVGGDTGACREWLYQRIILHLQSESCTGILLDDPISSATEQILIRREHPLFWQFRRRILWPIFPVQTNREEIKRALSWVGGFRTIAYFTQFPPNWRSFEEGKNLSEQQFAIVVKSLTSIVVDVFDDEGYMEWHRKS